MDAATECAEVCPRQPAMETGEYRRTGRKHEDSQEKVKRVHFTRDLRGGITSVFPLQSRWDRGQTRTYINDTFGVIEEFVSRPFSGACTMHAEAAFFIRFPSVLADDTLEPSPYQAALFHLRQGLQAL